MTDWRSLIALAEHHVAARRHSSIASPWEVPGLLLLYSSFLGLLLHGIVFVCLHGDLSLEICPHKGRASFIFILTNLKHPNT